MDNNIDYNWYFHVWKNYGNFEGRASRAEYWNFVLFNFLITIILGIVSAGIMSIIYVIAVIIPSLAVSVRRLHDIGKSGWCLLFALVPIIGSIYLIILFCTDSFSKENIYANSAPYFPYDN